MEKNKVSPRIAPVLPGERWKATALGGGTQRTQELRSVSLESEEAKAARVQGQSTREERVAQAQSLRDLQRVIFQSSGEHWPEHACGDTTQGPTYEARELQVWWEV